MIAWARAFVYAFIADLVLTVILLPYALAHPNLLPFELSALATASGCALIAVGFLTADHILDTRRHNHRTLLCQPCYVGQHYHTTNRCTANNCQCPRRETTPL